MMHFFNFRIGGIRGIFLTGCLLLVISLAGSTGYQAWETAQMKKLRSVLQIDPIINELDSAIADYNWDYLAGINEDIRGWLLIPDTIINYAVTGTIDDEYYLSHNFFKEKSSTGCPFMDKDTKDSDFNKVIYAHNMGYGSTAMFSTLRGYKDENYFREHKLFYFTEAYGDTITYQVMAVMKYDVKDIWEWDFRARNYSSDEEYHMWMEQLKERSLFYEEPDHPPVSMLMLATCDRTEFGRDGRLLVIGVRQ